MIVGIDLGVTDRRVGVCRNAAVDPVPDAFGLPPTPSAISLGGHGDVLVGPAQREHGAAQVIVDAAGRLRRAARGDSRRQILHETATCA